MAVSMRHTVHPGAIRSIFVVGSPSYRDIIRRAIRVQNGARRRAPVDTGRLRSSINVTAPVTNNQGVAGARVGSNVEYAIFVHEGTRYMIGRPFLADALMDARG